MAKHTLSVLVENKPGVLARVAGLFSRRGFNIDSLAVGPTEVEELSRMTIVVDAAAQSAQEDGYAPGAYDQEHEEHEQDLDEPHAHR
jgi:hypothetical protein